MIDEALERYFMREAYNLAKEAYNNDEVPVGAVVVSGTTIIGKASNSVERLRDTTAHAEMLAITAASEAIGNKFLDQCIMFVSLEPCPMCAAALGWSRLGTLYYAAGDNRKGFTLYSPSLLHPKTIVRRGMLENECAELVRTFFKTKR